MIKTNILRSDVTSRIMVSFILQIVGIHCVEKEKEKEEKPLGGGKARTCRLLHPLQVLKAGGLHPTVSVHSYHHLANREGRNSLITRCCHHATLAVEDGSLHANQLDGRAVRQPTRGRLACAHSVGHYPVRS